MTADRDQDVELTTCPNCKSDKLYIYHDMDRGGSANMMCHDCFLCVTLKHGEDHPNVAADKVLLLWNKMAAP
jgi:hypothetical protein